MLISIPFYFFLFISLYSIFLYLCLSIYLYSYTAISSLLSGCRHLGAGLGSGVVVYEDGLHLPALCLVPGQVPGLVGVALPTCGVGCNLYPHTYCIRLSRILHQSMARTASRPRKHCCTRSPQCAKFCCSTNLHYNLKYAVPYSPT
jgi:hypothetical protein